MAMAKIRKKRRKDWPSGLFRQASKQMNKLCNQTDILTLSFLQLKLVGHFACLPNTYIHLDLQQGFSKNRPLGRFFHRVAMSVYISIYLYISIYMSPFHVIFLHGRTGVDCHSSKNWCGASVAHAWSPKNEGWVQSVHRPRVEP